MRLMVHMLTLVSKRISMLDKHTISDFMHLLLTESNKYIPMDCSLQYLHLKSISYAMGILNIEHNKYIVQELNFFQTNSCLLFRFAFHAYLFCLFKYISVSDAAYYDG